MKCPEYRGGLISGVDLYCRAHIGTFQSAPKAAFGGFVLWHNVSFPRELVRKKAVMAMHHFYTLSPGAVSHLQDDFRRCLSDQDPGVMEAALILFHDMATVSEDIRNVPQCAMSTLFLLSSHLLSSLSPLPLSPPLLCPAPTGPPPPVQGPSPILHQHPVPSGGQEASC